MNNNLLPVIKLVNEGIPDDLVEVGVTLDRTQRYARNLKPGGECRCTAYSKDNIFFARSIGYGYFKISFYKSSTKNKIVKDILKSSKSNPPNENERCTTETWSLQIDCGELIESMKFSNETYDNHGVNFKSHLLATGLAKGRIKVWHPVTGEMIFNLADHVQCVNGLTFGPVGIPILLSCSNDMTLKVWDMDDLGNMTLTIKKHTRPVLDCAFNPVCGKMFCSVGEGKQAYIWTLHNSRDVQVVHQLKGHNNDVVACDFTTNGALLATASHDTFVFIWDPFLGTILFKLGHMNPIPCSIYSGGANGFWLKSVCFSRDNKRIATLCEDERLRVWHLFGNSPTTTCELGSPGNKCLFSPDNARITVGNDNGTVSVIPITGSVPSLCHLCRISARKTLSSPDLFNLSLPTHIRDYLMYLF